MNLERIRYVNTNRKSQVTDRTDLRERRNVGVLNVCVCLFSAGFYAKWLNVMRRIIIWWMFVWDSGHSDLHTHIRWFLSLKVTGPCGPEVVVCYNVCVCVSVDVMFWWLSRMSGRACWRLPDESAHCHFLFFPDSNTNYLFLLQKDRK